MLRTIIRATCLFCVALIIIHISNSKCISESVTLYHSRQFAKFQYGKTIYDKYTQMKKKVSGPLSWTKKSYLGEVYVQMKPYFRQMLSYLAFAIKTACLLVQHVKAILLKASQQSKGRKAAAPLTCEEHIQGLTKTQT